MIKSSFCISLFDLNFNNSEKQAFQLKPSCTSTIAFSLESTDDKLYSFIRGGDFTYSKDIVPNLKYIKEKFPNIRIKTNYLIGAFNIENMFTDMEKLIEDGFDLSDIVEYFILELRDYTDNRYMDDIRRLKEMEAEKAEANE